VKIAGIPLLPDREDHALDSFRLHDFFTIPGHHALVFIRGSPGSRPIFTLGPHSDLLTRWIS
jgi:hypothetical protein